MGNLIFPITIDFLLLATTIVIVMISVYLGIAVVMACTFTARSISSSLWNDH